MDTETQDSKYDDENRAVQRATFVPLIIFAFVVAIVAVIRICQIYLTPPEDTKYAIEALVGLLTLIVLIVQSGIIRMQWQAMQDTLRQSERSMRNGQAAYVMDAGACFGDYELGKPVVGAIEFRNCGATPAYDVCFYGHLTYEETPFQFTQQDAKSGVTYEIHPKGRRPRWRAV